MKRMRNCVLIFAILLLSSTVHAQFVTVDSFTVTPTGSDSGDFSYTITNVAPLPLGLRIAGKPPGGGEDYIRVETVAAGASFSDSFTIAGGLNDGDSYLLNVSDSSTGVEVVTATTTFVAPVTTTTSTTTSSTIAPAACTGEITGMTATSDGSDLDVVVNFENTGSVDCEFRVFLLNSGSTIVDKEPDTYWGNFGPGDTGSYTVSGSLSEFGDDTYNIELKDQGIGVVDTESGTISAAATCTGEITGMTATNDGSDLEVVVNFGNSGSVDCEFRVFLLDSSDGIVDKEPDLGWGNYGPGDTGSYTVSGSLGEFSGGTYKIELKDQGIGVVDTETGTISAAAVCTGEITGFMATSDGSDLDVVVSFGNTGSVDCEFRVFLLKSSGETVDKEPDLNWGNYGPGDTGSYTVSGSLSEFGDDTYNIELKDQGVGVVDTESGTVSAAAVCNGEITGFTATSDGSDLDVVVNFGNSGSVDCEFRVFLLDSGGTIVDKEPDTYWGNFGPGTTGSYTVSGSLSEFGDDTYNIELKDQGVGVVDTETGSVSTAAVCTGEITGFTATSDGSDLEVVVNFGNTGSVDCEFRVFLVNGSDDDVDKEPDTYWGNFGPGDTGSYTVSGSLSKFGDSTYTIELKDQGIGVVATESGSISATDVCNGEITDRTATSDGSDLEVVVSFGNSGSVDCEFRVFLLDSGGTIVDKEPDTYWGNFDPGETGSYKVSGSLSKFGDGTYKIELRDQHVGTVDSETGTILTADVCTGEITGLTANIVDDDLEVDVSFMNSGSVDCEFRVYLLKSNGDEVDNTPGGSWGNFDPGEDGSYTVSGSVNHFTDNIYKIELRDQHRGAVHTKTETVPGTVPITPTGACQGPPSDYLRRFECIVTILLCIMLYLTPPVVLFMLLVGGIRFMSDDPLKRKEGKQVIMLAIGGAVLVMVLLAVASTIAGIDVGMCWTVPEDTGCISNGGKCMNMECSNYAGCSAQSYQCNDGKHCCTGDCTGWELDVAIVSPADDSAFKAGDEINFDGSVSGGTPPYSYNFEIHEVTDVVGNYVHYLECDCIHNWLSSDEIEVSVRVMNPGDAEATFNVCVDSHCESITLAAQTADTVEISSNWKSWALPDLEGEFYVLVESGGSTLETYGPVNVPLSVDADKDCCDKFAVTIAPPRDDGALVVNKVHEQGEKSFSKSDLSPGNYLVTLTVTDSEGKNGASEIHLKVSPFTVRIDSPQGERFLEGEPVTFSASVDGGRPPYFYRWISLVNMESSVLNEGQVDMGDSINVPDFTRSDLPEGYHLLQLSVTGFVGEGITAYTVYDMNSFVIYSDSEYTFIYVPVGSWGSQEEFEDKATATQDFFLDISPLKDCKTELMDGTVYLDQGWVNDNCAFDPAQLVEDIKACADEYASSNGITYERAVGLSNRHLHDAYGYTHLGYKAVYSEFSVGISDIVPPIPEKETLVGPAHELGHTYFLCDEYSYSSWTAMNDGIGCPNRWPENCPVLDHECVGHEMRCCGETPTFRDYSGSYTVDGTQCSSGKTYSAMGFFATWQQCGYGVSSYEHLENTMGCP